METQNDVSRRWAEEVSWRLSILASRVQFLASIPQNICEAEAKLHSIYFESSRSALLSFIAGCRALLLPRHCQGLPRERVHPGVDGGPSDLQRGVRNRPPGKRDLRDSSFLWW